MNYYNDNIFIFSVTEKAWHSISLGKYPAFSKSSDVCMTQNKSEARTSMHNPIHKISDIFDVITHALTVTNIATVYLSNEHFLLLKICILKFTK